MARLIYHPDAKVEIRAAAEYYEGCRTGLGETFLATVEAGVNQVADHPLRWRKISPHFRRYLISRFPYGIIYAVEKDIILVTAVMHLKRKPDYWKGRIEP